MRFVVFFVLLALSLPVMAAYPDDQCKDPDDLQTRYYSRLAEDDAVKDYLYCIVAYINAADDQKMDIQHKLNAALKRYQDNVSRLK